MNAVTLLYHDVAEPGDPDASGFPGPGPAVYKLSPAELVAHFAALAATGFRPGSVLPLLDSARATTPTFITFDDGGHSALLIAGLLEERGWVGHFFVTTSAIGRAGFLDAGEIRELERRGHVIGSHSHTHPPRMTVLSPAQLREEWYTSIAILTGLLDQAVRVASVPSGFYSRAVAQAAEAAGIRALFTSEPVKGVGRVGACLVLGRYSITRGTAPKRAAALSAAGQSTEQARQYFYWNVKKVAKTVGGERYLALRRYLLRVG